MGLLFFAPHAGQTLALEAMSAPHVLHFVILFPISAPLYYNAHIRAMAIIARIWAIVNIEATPYD